MTLLGLKERPFDDGRIDQIKANLQQPILAAQVDVDAWKKLLDYINAAVNEGVFTEFESTPAAASSRWEILSEQSTR